MTRITVASLNVSGLPLSGSPLAARYRAIGGYFEASDADVVCFQEVYTYLHLALLARQMRSFRYVGLRRTVRGPAGDVVTFSRLPVLSSVYQGFGPAPAVADIGRLSRLQARMKGVLVTRLARPGVSVINTHPVANADGDWSPANRFFPVHRAQFAMLAGAVSGAGAPVVVCGDFNLDRESMLFGELIADTGLTDAFEGNCPATFHAEYLPAGATARCIDFILTSGDIKADSAELVFQGKQMLRGGPAYVSDHLGLRTRLHFPGP